MSLSLKFKLNALVATITILLIGVGVLVFPPKMTSLGETLLRKNAAFVGSLLAENLALGMQARDFDDGESIRQTLGLLSNEDEQDTEMQMISSITIVDAELAVVAGNNPREGAFQGFEKSGELTFEDRAEELGVFCPLVEPTDEEQVLGYVHMVFPKDFFLAESRAFASFTWIAGGAILVLVLLASYFVTSSINRVLARTIQGLTETSERVSTVSQDIADSSLRMAASAEQQRQNLEEVGCRLESMSSMTSRNAEDAQASRDSSNEAEAVVSKGNDAMVRMEEAMSRIKTSSAETAKIVKSIEEIAFQTNLLALNAAVEAARASEAGKGFAVVAEEVRNLAQRSADASKSSSQFISGAQEDAENGVRVSDETSSMLERIAESVRRASELTDKVSVASREQAEGIDEIGKSLTEVEGAVRENTDSTTEVSSAAQALKSLSNSLVELMHGLRQVVEGGSEPAAAESADPAHLQGLRENDPDPEESQDRLAPDFESF